MSVLVCGDRFVCNGEGVVNGVDGDAQRGVDGGTDAVPDGVGDWFAIQSRYKFFTP